LKKINEYLKKDFELLERVTNLIHSTTGEFDEVIAYENDNDFFLTFFEKENPMEIVRQVCLGFYSYDDEYVTFVEGDLTSMPAKEYHKTLLLEIDEISQRVVDLFDHIKAGIGDKTFIKLVEDLNKRE